MKRHIKRLLVEFLALAFVAFLVSSVWSNIETCHRVIWCGFCK